MRRFEGERIQQRWDGRKHDRRQRPVRRYETRPGQQLQFDWGEFIYDMDGTRHKLYGFAAVLGYSRMRFVCFTKRCDTPTLIRSLMAACEYLEGLPDAILTDRMKSVILTMDGRQPQWNPQFADFLAAIGVTPRVCRAYTPQTKGKIERSIGVVKSSFWAGVRFTDLADSRQIHSPSFDITSIGPAYGRQRDKDRAPIELHDRIRAHPKRAVASPLEIPVNAEYYAQYMTLFEKGVFRCARHEIGDREGEHLIRNYFSGGISLVGASETVHRIRSA